MSAAWRLGSRMRLLGAGLLVVTFIAGGLAGAAFHQVVMADDAPAQAERRDREHEHDRGPRPSPFEGLGLTADQQTRIDAVLENRKIQLDSLWNQNGRRIREVYDSTRAEIRVILTPEQRAEMDRRREERRARQREAERKEKQHREGQHSDSSKGGKQ